MKNPALSRFRGFTLIELLVVIAIIAVLAAAGFGAGTAAINRARKVKAEASARAVDTAVVGFYTDYSSMPTTAQDDTVTIESNGATGIALLEELLGTTDSELNTKQIKYLNVQEGKNDKDGLIYTGSGTSLAPTGLYDPWGNNFEIFLDGNYDEIIQVPDKASGTKPLNSRRVATFGVGGDKEQGTKDDIKTY